MKSGTIFSNFLISDDVADATAAAEALLVKMAAEKDAKAVEDDAKKAEEPADEVNF